MIHNYAIEGEGIRLRPLAEDDIEQLRIWRNDVEATKYLRPIPNISKEQQQIWFNNYKADNDTIIFAIIDDSLNEFVGSVALYDFDKEHSKCEAGKIQIGDKESHGKGLASKAMALVSLLAFNLLNVKTVIATVHEKNIAAYRSYIRIGFQEKGKTISQSKIGGFDLKIELTKNDLYSNYYDFVISSHICK